MSETSSARAETWDRNAEAERLQSEMAAAVQFIGDALAPRQTQDRQIQKAAERISITWGQAKRLWHRECLISGVILERVRSVKAEVEAKADRRRAELDAKRARLDDELDEIKRRLAHLEATPREARDSDVHSTIVPVGCKEAVQLG